MPVQPTPGSRDPVQRWLHQVVSNGSVRRIFLQRWNSWITHVPAPQTVQVWLSRIAEHPDLQVWVLDMFQHRTLPLFLNIIAYSPFLAQRMMGQPAYFRDLFTEVFKDWTLSREEWFERLERYLAIHTDLDIPTGLALFRHRGWARVLGGDIGGRMDLADVTCQLSYLADAVVEKAYREAGAQAGAMGDGVEVLKDGHRWTLRLGVFAVGKWGGLELNYSSDIDLLLLGDGAEEAPESIKRRLAEKVDTWVVHMLDHLRMYTPVGRAYRVDLRLRPLGREGELTLFLKQAESYYKTWADVWEKQALLKCRWVCGDRNVGESWDESIRRLLSRPFDPPVLIKAIERMRRKRIRALGNDSERDFKDGPGGIRDIEFLVQVLQWLNLEHHPLLFNGNTMKSLTILRETGLLKPRDARCLSESYEFLRRCEHILQVEENRRRTRFPGSQEERDRFAAKMGFSGDHPWESFWQEARHRMRGVLEVRRRVLERIEVEKTRPEAIVVPVTGDMAVQRWMDLVAEEPSVESWFTTEAWKGWINKLLNGGLYPQIRHHLAWLANLFEEQPRVAERFYERPGWIGMLQSILILSPVLSESLWRYGRLLGEPVIGGLFDAGTDWKMWLGMGGVEKGTWSLAQRARAMELVMGFLEFSGRLNRREAFHLHTLRVETILKTTFQEHFYRGLERIFDGVPDGYRTKPPVWLIGLGRLGCRELDWGSDADLVVVYDRLAWTRAGVQRPTAVLQPIVRDWLADLSRWTPWGYLVGADMRLRPFGVSGEPVQNAASMLEYFANRAGIWEMVALLKSRRIFGDARSFDEWMEELQATWNGRGWSKTDLVGSIRGLLDEWGKAYPRDHLKFGQGGWMEWWMLVHLYQAEIGWPRSTFWKRQVDSSEWQAFMAERRWLDSETMESVRGLWRILHWWRLMGFRSQQWTEDQARRLEERLSVAGHEDLEHVKAWPRIRFRIHDALLQRLG